MSCYHPLKAFVIRVNSDGTKKLKITSYQVDHVEQSRRDDDSTLICVTRNECADPNLYRVFRDFIEIPCGKCWGCRLDYSRTWANRLMMELEDHDEAWFLTLTYDSDHVPMSAYPDPETGEAVDCMTLSKRDWQLFMKRLRKEYDAKKIRFFASGEYGSKTARPHYHAIVYDLHFEPGELKFHKMSNGFRLYRSDRLDKVWSNGFCIVAEVTWESCAYVARYCMKKVNGEMSKFYDDFNLEPEFCLMSRKPGIARNYYEKHKDEIYKYDKVNLSTAKRGVSTKPPKYFDQIFDGEDPDRMTELKEQRKIAAERLKALELEGTDLDYIEYLAVKEKAAIDRQKILLKRSRAEDEA